MRNFVNLVSVAAIIASQVAVPAIAAPGDRMAKPEGGTAKTRPTTQPAQAKPMPAKTMPQSRPAPANADKSARPARPETTNYNRPNTTNYNNNRPNNNYNRPATSNNNVVTGNTVVVGGKPGYNNSYNNRYPVYQTPSGGYYRPPNGGYYRPPPPPPGGWHGGYYPPPQYYYDDGPSVGDVIAGVAVTGTLLYVLTQATKPKQQTTTVQGGPPPMAPPPMAPPPQPQPYVPPKNSTGAPASINVDISGMPSAARPSASVCLTEAARQIGATGGTEIRVDKVVNVEPGNGGYRFRINLLGVYPDETRMIPMYCRATSDKIVELTFG
jgi:hypothetical protein